MKRKLFIAMMALGSMVAANAQETNEMPKPDLTGESLEQPMDMETIKALGADSVGEDGQAQWYVAMDYAGFDFEVPAGMIVQKGSSFLARYPDGSFGISMINQALTGSNQKIAYEMCRRQASELHLPNPKIEKMKFGKCDGAIATGTMEGQNVSIIVLPYNNQQVTTVMLSTPNRKDWTDHFLQTLRK